MHHQIVSGAKALIIVYSISEELFMEETNMKGIISKCFSWMIVLTVLLSIPTDSIAESIDSQYKNASKAVIESLAPSGCNFALDEKSGLTYVNNEIS